MNWIKSKIHLIVSDKKAQFKEWSISLQDNQIYWNENHANICKRPLYKFNLYFTSDEAIKENDAFLTNQNGHWELQKCKQICNDGDIMSFEEEIAMYQEDTYFTFKRINCFKVIATTDKSLGLPEPSKDFLEVYVKAYSEGNKIEEVLVEYEYRNISDDEGFFNLKNIAKVKPDNTITIKKLKNSWNREEVERLLYKYSDELGYLSCKDDYNNFNKFIEQNL